MQSSELVEAFGHEAREHLIEFSSGDHVTAHFRIAPAPVLLEGVEVRAEARDRSLERTGFFHRQSLGLGSFIDEEAIRARNTRRLSDLLGSVRGLTLERPQGGGALLFNSRDVSLGGRCAVPVFIDGVRVTREGEPIDVDTLVPVEHLLAIEVYAGGGDLPAQYAGRCGAVLLWTR